MQGIGCSALFVGILLYRKKQLPVPLVSGIVKIGVKNEVVFLAMVDI
jgi:hypothetical protein